MKKEVERLLTCILLLSLESSGAQLLPLKTHVVIGRGMPRNHVAAVDYACPKPTWSHIHMRKFVGIPFCLHIYTCAYTRTMHADRYAATSFSKTVNTRASYVVGCVFGKPGPHTRPSCYFYCLHRAQNWQNLKRMHRY